MGPIPADTHADCGTQPGLGSAIPANNNGYYLIQILHVLQSIDRKLDKLTPTHKEDE